MSRRLIESWDTYRTGLRGTRIGLRGPGRLFTFGRLCTIMLLSVASPVLAQSGEAPANLTVSLAVGEVTLTWDAPTTDALSVTGYPILRRAGLDASVAFTAIDTASSTTYVDGSVSAGEELYVPGNGVARDGSERGVERRARGRADVACRA